jgi:dihydroorotase-like cyclic amidohydrolase
MTEPTIDELLCGSIDMHLHSGPDVFPCRVNALEAAKQARQVGMRAIVIKNHSYPTTPLTLTVGQLVPEVAVFGSICLDFEIGGLNADALEKHAEIGAKVVWMPTFSSTNSRAKMRKLGIDLKGDGFSILNARGELVSEIDRILEIIKKHEMVLASGHVSPAETFALIRKAREMGIEKVVITHPSDAEFVEQALTLEELQRLARMGAFIEQTIVSLLPTEFYHNPQERVETIKAIGVEHCIMSTDLGQYWNPPPAEGMRFFMAILLRNGLSTKDIAVMVKENPARLLSLDQGAEC